MSLSGTAPALLMDRDGTLIEEKHYLSDPDQVTLLPGVGESLAALAALGIRFFLVSNQSGIGRGYFSLEAALAVNERLSLLLSKYGVNFSDMIFCPHAPEADCDCRKPKIGMWQVLRERHCLAPEACIMIGDKREDMGFASAAGFALRVLVLTGHGREAANALGIKLLGERYLELTAAPISALHPHLLLPSFSLLIKGLSLFATSRRSVCGA